MQTFLTNHKNIAAFSGCFCGFFIICKMRNQRNMWLLDKACREVFDTAGMMMNTINFDLRTYERKKTAKWL